MKIPLSIYLAQRGKPKNQMSILEAIAIKEVERRNELTPLWEIEDYVHEIYETIIY